MPDRARSGCADQAGPPVGQQRLEAKSPLLGRDYREVPHRDYSPGAAPFTLEA